MAALRHITNITPKIRASISYLLPTYLCIQFMRFFWKETADSRDHQGIKCKIFRKVAFVEVSSMTRC